MIDGIYLILIFLIICIPVVAYLAKRAKNISDTVVLDFSGRDCHMKTWLEQEIPKKYILKDSKEVAQQALEKIYNRKVAKNKIAIGINLYEKYHKLTGEVPLEFYDLRSTVGLDYQIVVTDSRSAEKLVEDHDYSRILDLLQYPDRLAELMKYFKTTMNWRWNQLNMDDGNSYFYSPIEVPKVKGKLTNLGYRYNLSTTEKEFNAFIKRYQKAALTRVADVTE